MKKSFGFSVISLLGIVCSTWSTIGGWCSGVVTSAWAWADHLVPFKLSVPTEIRADLLLGRMPEPPSVSSRATVVKLDQRPHLREYLLPQNKFAY